MRLKGNDYDDDKKMYKLIEDFANDSSVAIGGHITVRNDNYSTGMTPTPPFTSMRYEDTTYLNEIISGATQLLYWLRREGYVIKPPHKPRKK